MPSTNKEADVEDSDTVESDVSSGADDFLESKNGNNLMIDRP